MQSYVDYSPNVQLALQHNEPVLALESTLITHGLPYPQNLQLAKEVEKIALEIGVTPATIAILNGRIKIGLSEDDLQILVNDKAVAKASTRDIPYLLSQNQNAGTTVAATMYCAHQAGIKVFATGGIGGVHRGETCDVSADLIQLANTPVAVVCAGAKAILDLPRTLEYLETQSVPVIGYCTNVFPAFYTSATPYQLNTTVNNMTALSELLNTHWALGMRSGILIANPIPVIDEIPAAEIEPIIAVAVNQAQQQGLTGKDVTPYLLSELTKATHGRSLKANVSLIKHNVKIGAELALQISMHQYNKRNA